MFLAHEKSSNDDFVCFGIYSSLIKNYAATKNDINANASIYF